MQRVHLGCPANGGQPNGLPFLCNELWWAILALLPLNERMEASRVCRKWRTIACSQLHFLDLTTLTKERVNGITTEEEEEECKAMAMHNELLDRMIRFLVKDCPNVKGLSLPPDLIASSSSSSHLSHLQISSLSSLSLFCCKNLGDHELLHLCSPSTSISQHLETLIICGTSVTRAGLKV